MSSDSGPLITLLRQWREGDKDAGDRLFAVMYPELRRLAGRYMRQERPDHTLQATGLVHELYFRLFRTEPVQWQNKAHFLAVAAKQLRRILVNYARDRQAEKRGGKRIRIELSGITHPAQSTNEDLLDVISVLEDLERLDPRAARVIELRFFGGLTEQEAAEALEISVATLKRDWDFARVWLVHELRNR
jgi:RNA polymerase sigma factor (TIGR02999 family)